jgi:LacI family transcriptional regulator
MRVRMREVAQRANVSTQTVSAVLNGKSGISAATTLRVRQAIEAMGYSPNLLASSLRSGRRTTIGLLLNNVANPFFAEIARGVQDVAQAHGYSVILCNHDGDPVKIRAYLQLLNQYQVAGILGEPGEEIVGPNSVAPGGHVFGGLLPGGTPEVDEERGGYVATAHLLDLGHRRIACITGPRPSRPGDGRLAGYRAALHDWSVAVDERLIVQGAFDFASGLGAWPLLEQDPRPTAIFAHNDLMAIGVMAALRQAGLRVPEDVAVVGYDNTEIAGLYDPPLTTVAQPTYNLGAHSMTLLADRLAGNPLPPTPAPSLACELIVRRSSVPGLDGDRYCGPIAAEESWRRWRAAAEVALLTDWGEKTRPFLPDGATGAH